MGDKTSIPWTNATWNPISGCTQCSRGCANCYAFRVSQRFHPERDFGVVQCHIDRLDQPSHWKKPRKIMVPSMGDLFHKDVPDSFLDCVFEIIKRNPRHIFQITTKRPERMAEYLDLYDEGDMPHVWLGVSVEDQEAADKRIPLLLNTPAAVHWVSAEPLLGPVDLTRWMWGRTEPCDDCPKDEDCECGYQTRSALGLPSIDWVVCGSESGPRRREADIAWVRDLRDQCTSAGIPYFLKQMYIDGRRVEMPELDGKTWGEYPQEGNR